MPELPEVEITRRGIAPEIEGAMILDAIVRNPRLRWPIPDHFPSLVQGRTILAVKRRAKYILIELDHGYLVLHLGMSGSFRFVTHDTPIEKHDHVDLIFKAAHGGTSILRYRDPRRFGAILWTDTPQHLHPLLSKLGPEPLGDLFDAAYLSAICHRFSRPIKQLIMEGEIVVGVGNIYANEALFLARIQPLRPAHSLSRDEVERLVSSIRQVLQRAIETGGSTLRDFQDAKGKPGYFQQEYNVYGRNGFNCHICNTTIISKHLGGRHTFWCEKCQH
ncbi:bifunctional DNA-formamidopyrimidine glycosylase/DNA-(apurinic or apyrimidinic site) lyase [Burkholderiaceae bacterium DAT-1]|nr:bifunctional DNA-formamidopyrimidine glycosylase/DNA-(apurinic or apyrimidinic site) lyase [Burkholderiaceae bacterium DAT-1]